MARDYANLGLIHEQKGNKSEAKHYYEMSLELFKYIGSPNAQKVQKLLDDLESNPS